MHLPSFLIGSLTSGTGFLLIHKELSHRRRLSKKWAVTEIAEAQFKNAMKQIQISRLQSSESVKPSTPWTVQARSTWNQGVSLLQDFFRGE
mmetsp:Transcript_29620/g.81422  ORF Transcript_29620/g.81422 Transcript_29620/m.81422 type:complete len:91 (+) Transcript_29620:46-318(+)